MSKQTGDESVRAMLQSQESDFDFFHVAIRDDRSKEEFGLFLGKQNRVAAIVVSFIVGEESFDLESLGIQLLMKMISQKSKRRKVQVVRIHQRSQCKLFKYFLTALDNFFGVWKCQETM
jgi:hypothetical protein